MVYYIIQRKSDLHFFGGFYGDKITAAFTTNRPLFFNANDETDQSMILQITAALTRAKVDYSILSITLNAQQNALQQTAELPQIQEQTF